MRNSCDDDDDVHELSHGSFDVDNVSGNLNSLHGDNLPAATADYDYAEYKNRSFANSQFRVVNRSRRDDTEVVEETADWYARHAYINGQIEKVHQSRSV